MLNVFDRDAGTFDGRFSLGEADDVRFAIDSPLEETVRCELVSPVRAAPDEYLECIKRGSVKLSKRVK